MHVDSETCSTFEAVARGKQKFDIELETGWLASESDPPVVLPSASDDRNPSRLAASGSESRLLAG